MIHCLKRSVICKIYDKNDNLLSEGNNFCNPLNNECQRMHISQNKDHYTNDCNSEHAEINAIKNLPLNTIPYKAILSGHSFYCLPCENALKNIGIEILEIREDIDPNDKYDNDFMQPEINDPND